MHRTVHAHGASLLTGALALTLVLLLSVTGATMAPASAAQARDDTASFDASAVSLQSARITGREYWRLDGLCRGSTDPDVIIRACRKRERALKSLGHQTVSRFHRAWMRGDRKTVRRIVANDLYLPYFRGRATRKRDCSYDAESWTIFCWMKPRGRDWIGVRIAVTRYERPLVPRWQVVAAAPDV